MTCLSYTNIRKKNYECLSTCIILLHDDLIAVMADAILLHCNLCTRTSR